ncbi:MAG TPA: CusA/CzcA family heavy metal efflux RND transporter [Polyangiaceae bacterium]|nr:CusA/CzcA family heavy metal efflux RND transporter [Polyangiaceae bacterium]
MIQKLVAVALRMPIVVLVCTAVVIGAGLFAYSDLDIEAYPNPVPPLVEVITQPEGWSAEEVERYVTVPLEVGLSGMAGLDHIRSQSLFGLSDIKCYFKWGTKYEAARQEVINRMQFVELPKGVQPELSPWNAIGEVFRYQLKGDGYTLRDLKTAQDWTLERQFRQVPGVIDVTSFGGETKQYHVNVDPYRLRGHNVTLTSLMDAVGRANQNVGGQRLVIGEQSYNVRGIGLLRSVHDIEDVVIESHGGVPVRVKDVATVDIGGAPRLGQVGHDEEPDIVEGVVLMRYGAETPDTLKGIHERLAQIERDHLLPPGMKIVPIYDRGNLVKLTTHTVLENLLLGMGLVAIVLFVFLGHTRAAIITAINIPIALLVAFIGLVTTGTSTNLISIGAVDFGIVVDSTVIVIENIFRHLGSHGRGTMRDRILAGAREVVGPMAFSKLILAVAFIPLFTMTGVSGVIFSPMAWTYAFALTGAVVMALTLTPVLASKLISADTEEKENAVMRTLHRIYRPPSDLFIRRPWLGGASTVVLIALCVAIFPLLGGEFMPKLEEGNFWIRATLPTSVSLEQSSKYVQRMRDILRGCPEKDKCTDESRRHPEVVTVVSQIGRPDDGTDVSGFHNIELFAPLLPFDKWKHGLTKEKLTDELSSEPTAAFPGVVFNFSQMIGDNVEEAMSGVKGENSVKVVGADLYENEKNALAIADVMGEVRGVKDLGVFRSLGQPSVKITPDRAACSRFGLNTGDVDQVIQAAIGGMGLTAVYEGEKHFDLTVRWLKPYRESLEAIREITVHTPTGQVVPLGQIAHIGLEEGPSVIFREDGKRYVPVKFSVRGRDLSSTVSESKQRVADKVHLPYDSHLEWGGEMNELGDALGRLVVIVPFTLLLIVFLVYGATRNWIDTIIAVVSIPVSCTGGALALLLTGVHFSVSAAMGFISIFGVAIQDAILVVAYFQQLHNVDGLPLEEAAAQAGEKRFRPALMTTLVATLGLLPAALSNGIGAQTQKPLALVVIGGSLILALTSRIRQPGLIVWMHRWLDRFTPAQSVRAAD